MTTSSFSRMTFALLFLAGAAMPLHAEPEAVARRVVFQQSSAEPYALVREGQRTRFVDSHRSNDTDVDSLKATYPGNFIWFRESGKWYIVREADGRAGQANGT